MDSTWLDHIRPTLRPPDTRGRLYHHAGSAVAAPNWVEAERVIYDHEWVFVSEGRFVLSVAGKDYPCPAGSFIIVPPGRAHATWNTGGLPGRRHWVHFDWVPSGPYRAATYMSFLPGPVRRAWLRPAPAFVPTGVLCGACRDPLRVRALHQALLDWIASADSRAYRSASGLLWALLVDSLDASPAAPSRRRSGERLAERVRQCLDRTVEEGPPIPELRPLLESLGVSAEHATRAFRANFGMPPHRYLQSLRIARAKLLLRERPERIAKVAERLGFEDVPWFCQLFRRHVGMSPSAWRGP